ncbi:N-acetylornithine carbamoyltransferase [Balneolales bacterium ANBcel1]|nr:N-acetylornithine carbamoyltransferase [Balneolales bacterium ANBcel1]
MSSRLDSASHFLHLSDWNDAGLREVLDKAKQLKEQDYREPVARGKVLGLIFFNPSLRTRISFETAAVHLGAGSSIIQPGQGTWTFETRTGAVMDGDRTEHLKEAVQVISRYADVIGVRAFAGMQDPDADFEDRFIRDIAEYATVPVINMESAREHPCQALADGLTIMERFGNRPEGKKFVLSWAPHPKALPMAVPNSALEIAARLGMEVTLACPPGMEPDQRILDGISGHAERNGSSLDVSHDQQEAFQQADIIYGKSWAGPLVYRDTEAEHAQRTETYADWTINEEKMALTSDAGFMHCLPVRRNVVVTDGVLDGPGAIHIGQAENRLHAQKAVLLKLWGLL